MRERRLPLERGVGDGSYHRIPYQFGVRRCEFAPSALNPFRHGVSHVIDAPVRRRACPDVVVVPDDGGPSPDHAPGRRWMNVGKGSVDTMVVDPAYETV